MRKRFLAKKKTSLYFEITFDFSAYEKSIQKILSKFDLKCLLLLQTKTKCCLSFPPLQLLFAQFSMNFQIIFVCLSAAAIAVTAEWGKFDFGYATKF